MEDKDKFLGCIYGLAIGDALGYPVEFMQREDLIRKLGKEVDGFDSLRKLERRSNMPFLHPVGSYSDDTQMALATANGILNSNSDDNDALMDSIAREYVRWYHSPENNRAPGNTCMAGCKNLAKRVHWTKSGVNGTGCGAAMRTAPIGLYFARDSSVNPLCILSQKASYCTHTDPSAKNAGIMAAFLTRLAVHQTEPDKILQTAKATSAMWNEQLRKKILQVEDLLNENKPDLNKVGYGFRGDEAIALALYCFLKSPEDYKQSVLRAVNIDGDSDSVASITGALSGAYNGIASIPKRWIKKIENRNLLEETAIRLYNQAKQRGH